MEKLPVNKKSITIVGMKVYWDAQSKRMYNIIPCKVLSSNIPYCLISTHRNFLIYTDQIFNDIDFRYLKRFPNLHLVDCAILQKLIRRLLTDSALKSKQKEMFQRYSDLWNISFLVA